jgi:hypothetical protein
MFSESDVKRMPLNQKLRIMEMIWDDLSSNEDSVNSPSWHKDILQEREKGLETGEMTISSWEEAKTRIKRNVS